MIKKNVYQICPYLLKILYNIQKRLINIMQQNPQKPFEQQINILFQSLVHKPNIQPPQHNENKQIDKSLDLQINNSIGYISRYQIQNPLPIPKFMLSFSNDAFHPQNQSYQQKLIYHEPQLTIQAVDHLITALQLQDIVQDAPNTTHDQNTKNVLRNFGSAQNRYILYNKKAKQYLTSKISHLQSFYTWVHSLKLQNFQNYKSIWTSSSSSSHQQKIFKKIYKKLCWDFYTQHSIIYVLSSRIKINTTKNSHLKYIYRFLQGLQNPQQFNYFKKIY